LYRKKPFIKRGGFTVKIGDRLRRLRKERQFSLEEIAQRSGLGYIYLLEIENEHKLPPLEVLERIAKVLNVTPYRLLCGGVTPPFLANLPNRKSADEFTF
jgi:transcriptional regulator with XRE-family HTH domain